MINKNFDDIAKISNAIKKVAEELREDEIKFDLRDLTVNLIVSEKELSNAMVTRNMCQLKLSRQMLAV